MLGGEGCLDLMWLGWGLFVGCGVALEERVNQFVVDALDPR
jgi:hypothetical protein